MAIKNIIAMGIGFSPGSVKFIPTLGFSIGAAAAITIIAFDATWDGTGPIPEGLYKNVTNSTNEIKIQGKLVGGVQQTIDGQNSISITTGFGQVHLISDGTNLMKFD